MSTSLEPQAAVSVGCGCLCDDVLVRLDSEGRVVEVEGGCESCRSWFLSEAGEADALVPRIDLDSVSLEEALDTAVALLRAARSPLIYGLSSLTNQAQAAALALADRIGAAVDCSEEIGSYARVLSTLRLGSMTTSWGEIRSRADLVMFWGCEPTESHVCFWDRFVSPPGRFVPNGRAGRTVLVAAQAPNDFFHRADHSLVVPADRQAETLHLLTWLATGADVHPGRAEASTGVPFADLEAWSSALRSSRYGVIVAGRTLLQTSAPQAAVEAMLQLVRSRNEQARFAVTWIGRGMNPAGAEAVLTRQAGFPNSIDFAGGFPRFLPLDACSAHRNVGPEAHRAHLQPDTSSSIWNWPAESDLQIGFGATTTRNAEIMFVRNRQTYTCIPSLPASFTLPTLVTLPTSTPGFDTPGTITRSDEIPIPLRPLRPATLPTAEALLTQLLHRLEPRP